MAVWKRLTSGCLMLVIAGSFLVSTGCTRHPNEEQIRVMEEARAAALAAEKKLDETRQECDQLDKQLQAKKAELEKAKKERELIKSRLENWSGE